MAFVSLYFIDKKINLNIAIILLAAGPSSRMGQSKQLLKIGEESLLKHAVKAVLQSGFIPVVVVLGAEEEKLRGEIGNHEVNVISNPLWETGMGSSVKAGVKFILGKYPETEAIIICVCDQPLLSASHLKNLESKHTESGSPIVASRYGDSGGVPALFHRSLFAELAALSDSQGAKKIILQHPEATVWDDFPDGAVDLDTMEDYQTFLRKKIQ